jgi:hypothetical protein
MPNIIADIVNGIKYSVLSKQAHSYGVWGECRSCAKEAMCFLFDKNFKKTGPDNKKSYRLCPTCMCQTPTRLTALKNRALDDMPLYINDPNILVRIQAAERLMKGK